MSPAGFEDDPDAFVCPGQAPHKPLQNYRRSWRSIRKRASLDGVWIHDTRHTVATDMLAAGMELAEIAVVLGHKSTQTTKRYAHYAERTRRDISERMGNAIERRTREGAERLRRQAVGAHLDQDPTTDRASVDAMSGGKVIRLWPRGQR